VNEATIALTVMTGLIFLIFLGFLIWGLKSGQFKHIEDAKYRMLEDELKSEDKQPSEDRTPKDSLK
jgi:cbb3-type cytochrome oxidase maturation protein